MSTCPKTPFPSLYTAGRALIAVRTQMAAQSRTRVVTGIHPCTRCSAFHLTSDPKAATSKWTRRAIELAGWHDH